MSTAAAAAAVRKRYIRVDDIMMCCDRAHTAVVPLFSSTLSFLLVLMLMPLLLSSTGTDVVYVVWLVCRPSISVCIMFFGLV